MINCNCFLNIPILFNDVCKIYPPLAKEVVGNELFRTFQYLLTITQEELEDEFINKVDEDGNPLPIPTPFTFLLASAYNNSEFCKIAQKAFEFFIHEKVTFLYEAKMILIGDAEDLLKKQVSLKDLRLITEETYFDFQNKIRESMGLKFAERPDENEDPRVKRIKAKARYRDKIKAKKGMGISFGTSLIAICCMGIGLTPLNIGDISYAAVGYLTEMYQHKEKYDLDIRSILAGADSKKIKPKYWIKNLEDK